MALPDQLQEGEVVFALTSGIMSQTQTSNSNDWGSNTWLVVLTSERFLFMDCAMLTKSIDIQSIRHDKVQAVSSSQGWIFGKIMIDLGSRTIVVDNCNKATVPPFVTIANRWHKHLQDNKSRVAAPSAQGSDTDPVAKIERLAKLHSMGALTDEEFRTAKSKILSSM